MFGLSQRVSAMWVLGLCLAGCASGESASDNGASQPDDTLQLEPIDIQPDGASDTKPGDPKGTEHSKPPSDTGSSGSGGSSAGGMGSGGSGTGDPSCTCGILPPGIHIDHGGGKLTVSVDLPKQKPIVIELTSGSCETSETGIELKGELTVDTGGKQPLALIGADLQVKAAGTAGVTIDADVDVLGALDASALSLAAREVDLVDAHVHIAADSCECHRSTRITGNVTVGADVWASVLPLHAVAGLSAQLWLVDGELEHAALEGDVRLDLNVLQCSGSLLQAVVLADAKVDLSGQGIKVTGQLGTSIDPRLNLGGIAQITAGFDEHDGSWSPSAPDWSINLCGTKLVGPLLGLLQAVDCLNLDSSGAKACE